MAPNQRPPAPSAARFALFLAQFFAPAPIRIAHGVLMLAGQAWLAMAMWRANPDSATARPGALPVAA
jgi:hypothetical protein